MSEAFNKFRNGRPFASMAEARLAQEYFLAGAASRDEEIARLNNILVKNEEIAKGIKDKMEDIRTNTDRNHEYTCDTIKMLQNQLTTARHDALEEAARAAENGSRMGDRIAEAIRGLK